MTAQKAYVVVPNWNGVEALGRCLDSLKAQSQAAGIIVVDNASTDGSVALLEEKYPDVILIKNKSNRGFAGGANDGIKYATKLEAKYIALLNPDAAADKGWLAALVGYLDGHAKAGIATGKIVDADNKTLDSTGEMYTTWGLAYPRGRGEPADEKYDDAQPVFGASGGASIYRVKMLQEIGWFDEDFFLYYEDVDLSFRAQLAGWQVAYEPKAVVHHEIGASTSRVSGLYTYQTLKNLPMLFWKNVPWGLVPKMEPRFEIVYTAFFFNAIKKGEGWSAFKGWGRFMLLLPKKLWQRRRIQKRRKVSNEYLRSILIWDLPPNAQRLRTLRAKWWRLRRRKGPDTPPIAQADPGPKPKPTEPPRPAKIVIDARESGTSTGRYVDKLIEYLHQLESPHEIKALTKSDRVDFLKNIAPNFEVIESNSKEFTFAEQIGFLRQVRGLEADLVHFAVTQQPVRYRGRVVTTIHDLTTARFKNPAKNRLIFGFKQQVYKWVIKRVAQKSKHIITGSQYVKDDVANYAGISPDKISVTYEAADKITEAPQPVKDLAGKRFLLYVGRAQPHKNLERLVEAYRLLKGSQPDLLLVLAGKNDGNYKLLQKYVAKRQVHGVIFTDFVPEAQLRWLYEEALAYVFPSLSEGFGLPGLEAMLYDLPVVSSNTTCLPEIYKDGALYFDPLDPRDMVEKIKQVLADPQLAKNLAWKAQNVSRQYSWQKMAEETLAIYDKILD